MTLPDCLVTSSMQLFYVTLLRQPRSTLFPYTTLFRSHHRAEHGPVPGAPTRFHRIKRAAPVELLRVLSDGTGLGDRKSTRLNSSHSSISYAVFCLKKKKSDLLCST